eukprot:scaffold4748_cov124-Skeletonema_dohrnii-CCMP3373.AAC.8
MKEHLQPLLNLLCTYHLTKIGTKTLAELLSSPKILCGAFVLNQDTFGTFVLNEGSRGALWQDPTTVYTIVGPWLPFEAWRLRGRKSIQNCNGERNWWRMLPPPLMFKLGKDTHATLIRVKECWSITSQRKSQRKSCGAGEQWQHQSHEEEGIECVYFKYFKEQQLL